jgi:hypothetical protein
MQELAGHASITTTQGYMHLIPGAADDAVALLAAFDALESGHLPNEIKAAPDRLDTNSGAAD